MQSNDPASALGKVIADQNSAPSNEKSGMETTIADGTAIHRVTDLYLAVCLISVGVPLRKDPPFTATRLTNGQLKWVFNFEGKTSDGKKTTAELVKAFIESDKYIAENPVDLYTGALCFAKNLSRILEFMPRVKPWIAFRSPSGQSTIMCLEGSKRHANYIKKEWKRCDPFEDQKPRTR